MIKIYTDGSATKNRCGWGYVFIDDEGVCISSGEENNSTNQRMELTAAINGLNHWQCSYYPDDENVIVYSDSAYLINCYQEKWYLNWENNNWLNSKNEPVANKDLWLQLIPYFNNPLITFMKVKGHSGDKYNEWADQLARGTLTTTDLLTKEEKNDRMLKELIRTLWDFREKKIDTYQAVAIIERLFNE